MLPHLMYAVRTRRPSGSAFAWALGGITASVWVGYGFAIGDVLVAAPGLVTVPANFILAAWCAHDARRPVRSALSDVVIPVSVDSLVPAYVPTAWEEMYPNACAGDTLEMPRIVA
jgi:hypothetical protein